MSKSFTSTFGIVIKRGAANNSITRYGMVRDLASPDVEQRKANERAMTLGVVNLGGWAKPGKDRAKQRRHRKGFAVA